MNKVNLFVIGASKAGTTTLWNILSNHPEISMAKEKEIWAFSQRSGFDLNWYHSKFDINAHIMFCGEASPIYSETYRFPWIPGNIYRYNPEAKVIFIVRDPIDRLMSVWSQMKYSGHAVQSPYSKYTGINHEAMKNTGLNNLYNYPSFLDACRYAGTIRDYREYFNEQALFVLSLEQLKDDVEGTLSALTEFLGLSRPLINQKSLNQSKDKLRLNNRIIRHMICVLGRFGILIPTPFKNHIKNYIKQKNELKLSSENKKDIKEYLKDDMKEFYRMFPEIPKLWKNDYL